MNKKQFIIYTILSFLIYGSIVFAANSFPTSENNWTDGDVIESDWANQLEYRIGATGTTSASTLTYQVNQLMGTTTLPELSSIGTITTGVWNGTAIDISSFTNLTVSSPITITADDLGFDLTANLTITGDYNFGGGGIEIENGTTPPACTEGQIYFDTDATSGQRLYGCEGSTFVLQGDGDSGGTWTDGGDYLYATNGEGILINASSTIDNLLTTTATTTNFYLGSSLFTSLEGTGLTLAGGTLSADLGTSVDLTTEITGTLPVGNGGTGATTLTDGGLLLGSGTGAITALGVASNGQIPIGDGTTDPQLATLTATAGEIEITNGAGTITIGIVASPTLDGSNFTGIPAGAFDAASIDGDDINSNIAGRSLTLTAGSPDTLDVDSELYTASASANLIATSSNQIATSTDPWVSKYFHQAATIIGIYCKAWDTGTSTIKVQIAGTDVLYGGLQCGADENIASTTLSSTAISSGDRITIFVSDAEPTGSRPRLIEITPVWEWSD